ncbi:hypothetical protein Hypma_002519 [Hypsizygus marmoreus]|uniref:Uncharacterized protein n=1 Tax=Hypsizygus marmoreus TaxID=39966 RepID=A0A369J7V2_HYPMA|nr:hypothetical protein Hypma_002519 [Hypsizygus marmoreus]
MSTVNVEEINNAYFNASNFESLMRGIHFTVFLMALSNIFTGPQRGTHSRRVMTLLIVVMFVLSTVHNAAFWAYVHRAFITHGQTSQSVADALNEYPVWFTGVTGVSDANAVLADCIIIWRCWIVWGQNWWITVIPIICTMLTTAFSIIAIYSTVTSTTFGAVGVDYATALYSTSLATTIYCTGMIIYRIVMVGRSQRIGGGLQAYHNVMEILVESSALYCIATLFALVAYIRSGPASEYASAFWTSVTGIAPTLIVARVASGEARPDESWKESKQGTHQLSFLRFNGGGPGPDTPSTSYELQDSDKRGSDIIIRTTGYSDAEVGEASTVFTPTVASHPRSEKRRAEVEDKV